VQTWSKASRSGNVTPQLADLHVSTANQGSTDLVNTLTLSQTLLLPPTIQRRSWRRDQAPKKAHW